MLELLVVLVIVALLASLATPIVSKSVQQATESALKEDLFVMRKALDDYYADHGFYPEALSALVEEQYLRNIPQDPIARRENGQWALTWVEGVDGKRGIIDIHSSAGGRASDGRTYQQW